MSTWLLLVGFEGGLLFEHLRTVGADLDSLILFVAVCFGYFQVRLHE